MAVCRKCGVNAGLDKVESERQNKRVMKLHTCSEHPTCPNCPDNPNHRPTSNECQRRRKEVEIIRIKTDHQLTYAEAKARVNAEYVRTHRSFASVTSGAIGSGTFTSSEPQRAPVNSNIDQQISNAKADIVENEKKIAELKTLLKHIKSQEAEIRALQAEISRTQQFVAENTVCDLNSGVRTRTSSLGTLYDSEDDFSKMPPPQTTESEMEHDGTGLKRGRATGSLDGSTHSSPMTKQQKAETTPPNTPNTKRRNKINNMIAKLKSDTTYSFGQLIPQEEKQKAMQLDPDQLLQVRRKLSKTGAAACKMDANKTEPKREVAWFLTPTTLYGIWLPKSGPSTQ